MLQKFSRRNLFGLAAGAGAATLTGALSGQQAQPPAATEPVTGFERRAAVSVVRGEERRRIIADALAAVDNEIRPVLKSKKYVIIKPNLVSTVNPLASTHGDALRGILDYLAPRFKGPVIIAESSAGNTPEAYENFFYNRVVAEHRSQKVSLLDLNQEGKYELMQVLNADLHPVPVRLAARLLDPDAYVICSAILKTHNTVVATLSVKNMTLGAPLRSAPNETVRWNDKRKYHGGVRQSHYGILRTAQKMVPHWGATVIDGFEGMEGNGPTQGTPVPSRVAIASTDYVAADRVGLETMGIQPEWIGYLQFCHQGGVGQYDLDRIDIRGEQLAAVRREYRLHRDIDRELEWMGPMTELPPKLG